MYEIREYGHVNQLCQPFFYCQNADFYCHIIKLYDNRIAISITILCESLFEPKKEKEKKSNAKSRTHILLG
jgi:hypothetical protein